MWKTVNAGTTWTPVFDNEGSYSIGVVVLVILYLSVRVVQQYEKMIVFRLGRTNDRWLAWTVVEGGR